MMTNLKQKSDWSLLQLAAGVNELAFEELFRRYDEYTKRIVKKYIRDEFAAEDVHQEAWLRIWSKAEQCRDPNSAKWWIVRVVESKCLEFLRKYKRRSAKTPMFFPDLDFQSSDGLDVSAETNLLELNIDIRHFFLPLLKNSKVCVLQKVISENTNKESCKKAGVSYRATKCAMWRARRLLREAISQEGCLIR